MSAPLADAGPLEVWGGVECTVRRVGDGYFDQVEKSGHSDRPADLDRLATLGLKAVRYPVLWERTAPHGLDRADWAWPDSRLHRLRELGLRPIVGLLHHGSGPWSTSLVDPAFPGEFAQFARAVAERYPWVDDWTPVNEPLTTARFSGLYGHWYPHGQSAGTFAQALVHQCRAVALAMAEIRQANPEARLIQTEDLAKVHSTTSLRYQADWENERRWLSLDLLCGRLTPGSPMWGYLRQGVSEADLEWFLQNPYPPDVFGLNYYVTSERHLDERLERFPAWTHGGNDRQRYADVEAVRGRTDGGDGVGALLGEVLDRYHAPVAVTEAHIGHRPESRLRWLRDVWEAATRLRAEGHDVRAVTVWSLFGAYDWNSLLTRLDDHYEPGVFDLRSPEPRPTALAAMVRDLAGGKDHDHPVLEQRGWWLDPGRFVYGRALRDDEPGSVGITGRPLLITCASGPLGYAFGRICRERGLPHRLVTRAELDIANPASVQEAIAELRPWAICNAACDRGIDDAETDRDGCRIENVTGPAALATACAGHGLRLLTFSSDLVFGGDLDRPYVESDPVRPLSQYGLAKYAGERRVLRIHPGALVVRSGAPFGPWDPNDFLRSTLSHLERGDHVVAANDIRVSPTYLPDLVETALDLLIDNESGIWHLANDGAATWHELAAKAAELVGVDRSNLLPGLARDLGWAARRPAYSVLGSERGWLLPALDDALLRFARDHDDFEPEPNGRMPSLVTAST